MNAAMTVDEGIKVLATSVRQLQLELHHMEGSSHTDPFRLRTLRTKVSTQSGQLDRLRQLDREVRDLRATLTLKMMTRYPENRLYERDYRRELHQKRRQLADMLVRCVPAKPKRPNPFGYAR